MHSDQKHSERNAQFQISQITMISMELFFLSVVSNSHNCSWNTSTGLRGTEETRMSLQIGVLTFFSLKIFRPGFPSRFSVCQFCVFTVTHFTALMQENIGEVAKTTGVSNLHVACCSFDEGEYNWLPCCCSMVTASHRLQLRKLCVVSVTTTWFGATLDGSMAGWTESEFGSGSV